MDFAQLLFLSFVGVYLLIGLLEGAWLASVVAGKSRHSMISPILLIIITCVLLLWGVSGSPALHLVLLTVGIGMLLAVREDIRTDAQSQMEKYS